MFCYLEKWRKFVKRKKTTFFLGTAFFLFSDHRDKYDSNRESCLIFSLQVESTKKLPTLYLIDCIMKNHPKSTYPGLFSHNIVRIFCNMFEQVSIRFILDLLVRGILQKSLFDTYKVSSRISCSHFYELRIVDQ
jgi:hypothetical protein